MLCQNWSFTRLTLYFDVFKNHYQYEAWCQSDTFKKCILMCQHCADMFAIHSSILTINGNAISINGNRRPNLFMIYPKIIFPNKDPTHCNDATQDASSMEIIPDGNGVSSDNNRISDGLLHPSNTPNPMVAKFTVNKRDCRLTLKALQLILYWWITNSCSKKLKFYALPVHLISGLCIFIHFSSIFIYTRFSLPLEWPLPIRSKNRLPFVNSMIISNIY